MILISIITSCLIFIGVITVIILSHLDKIIDKSLKKKVTGHTLYYADFSEIKSMDEIFTYIKNKVVYR